MDVTAICRTGLPSTFLGSLGSWCFWTLSIVKELLLARSVGASYMGECVFVVGYRPAPTEARSIVDFNRGCVAHLGSGLSNAF